MVDKRSAPAFSMGSPLNKTKHTNDFNPGPGSYEPPSFINSSKISKTKQTG